VRNLFLTSVKDIVDVAFEFFDPNPKIDYHAIKRLLTQLFQRDSENINMHELTELILSQPTVGTTIKTDGIESDPYALLTVLNMHLHHVSHLSSSRFEFSVADFILEAKCRNESHCELHAVHYIHTRPQFAFNT
jgi:hypothetical protein